MTSVFISGSRGLGQLSDQVRERLENILAASYSVLVGDANGVDKSVQAFLLERGYSNVRVYCSGSRCRNNLGAWPVREVSVPANVSGRAFYTRKDVEMARDADYGLAVWDGKSAGTLNNVMELLKRDKKALVYFSPQRRFYSVSSLNDAESLLAKCAPGDIKTIEKKVALNANTANDGVLSQGALDI